jgi:hypothetical protein
MVLREGWNLLVSFTAYALEILFAFVTVGNPTISKQLIKKRNDKYPFHVNIFITSIINIQKKQID